MTAKTFIKEKLRELHYKFEDIQIRYEYRAETQTHLVEICPLNFFNENKSYCNEEEIIENEFECLFPEETIVFISDGFLSEIKNADLKLGYTETIAEPLPQEYEEFAF